MVRRRNRYEECSTVDDVLSCLGQYGGPIEAVHRAFEIGQQNPTFAGFKLNDKVSKIKGHRFNGTVIGGGVTSKGEIRLMTELDAGENAEGLLHIHNPDQMEKV